MSVCLNFRCPVCFTFSSLFITFNKPPLKWGKVGSRLSLSRERDKRGIATVPLLSGFLFFVGCCDYGVSRYALVVQKSASALDHKSFLENIWREVMPGVDFPKV